MLSYYGVRRSYEGNGSVMGQRSMIERSLVEHCSICAQVNHLFLLDAVSYYLIDRWVCLYGMKG